MVNTLAAPVNLTGSSQVVSNMATTLSGVCVAETSGTASAKIRIWDSATATSSGKRLLGVYTLAAGESREESIRKPAAQGVWVEVVSGAIEGSVFTGP